MSEATGNAPDGGWGWVIVGCAFTINFLSVGTMFTLSVLYMSLLEEFGNSKGATSWAISLGSALMYCIAPVPARLTSRFGHQAVVCFGGLLACTGFVISYFATSVLYLVVSIGTIAGVGLGFAYINTITLVVEYFNKRRSLAMGISSAGVGVGCLALAPFFHWLDEQYGWRGALLIIGAISLHLCLCGLLMRPLKITAVKTIGVISTDDPTDGDTMSPGEYEVLLKENPEIACVETEAHTEHSDDTNDTLLDSRKDVIVNKDTSERNDQRPSSDYLELPTHHNIATMGGSVQMLHSSTMANQDHFARLASSAMELRMSKLNRDKICLHLGNELCDRTGFLRIRDILMSGSIHSLTLIEGKLRASVGFTPLPNKSDDVPEVQTSTASHCPCPGSITRPCGSLFPSFALLKNGVFATFAISSTLSNLSSFMPFLYMVDRAVDNNIDKTAASFLVSLTGVGTILGRIFFGYLADRSFADRLVYYIGCLSVYGLSTSFSPLCGTSIVLHGVYAFTFGIAFGGCVMLSPLVTVDLVGVHLVGEAYGLLLLFMGAACIAGPPLAGWIVDWTGGFTMSYILHGFFVLLSALILLPVVYVRKCRKSARNEASWPSNKEFLVD